MKKIEISHRNESLLSSRAKFIQISISLLANLSVLSSGMALGYPSTTTQVMRDPESGSLNESQISWFASVASIACAFGGPISGYLIGKFGRKGTLIIIDILQIIHWLIIGLSSRDNNQILFIQLIIGRVLGGITIGMITTPAVTYSSEICHPSLRGRLTVLSTPFFIAIGILIIYFLGFIIYSEFYILRIEINYITGQL
jgi:MFS family permease